MCVQDRNDFIRQCKISKDKVQDSQKQYSIYSRGNILKVKCCVTYTPPLRISFVKSSLVFTRLLPGVAVTVPLNFVKNGVPLHTDFKGYIRDYEW